MTTNSDPAVWRAIVESLQDAMDTLVAACLDADGKPKAPDRGDIMKARAMLPPRCVHALKK